MMIRFILLLSLWMGCSPLLASPPLFEKIKTEKGERWTTRPSMTTWMREQRLIPEKSRLRVVCLGGSVTYGFPMPKEGAYPHIIQSTLEKLFPDSDPAIVSMGLLNGNVKRLEEVLDEALELQPQVVVLEVGSMESLSRWATQGEKKPPAYLGKGPYSPPPMDRSILKGESLSYFEDRALQGVENILNRLKDEKIEVILLFPGSNPKARPLYDGSEDQLHSGVQKEIAHLMTLVEDTAEDDSGYTIRCLDRILELAPKSPSFHFIMAQHREKYGHFGPAREFYQKASDLDQQPLRPRDSVRLRLKKLAEKSEAHFVDGKELAESIAKVGLVGYREYFDHLHPRRELHMVFAQVILKHMGINLKDREDEFKAALNQSWNWKDRVWSEVWARSGQALWFCGEGKMAQRLFQESLKYHKMNPESLISLSHLLVLGGEEKVSASLLELVLGNNNWTFLPKHLKKRLAEALAIRGDKDFLGKILKDEGAQESDPEWSHVYGYYYLGKKEHDKAIPLLKTALESSPLNPLLLRGLEYSFIQTDRWVEYLQWLKTRLVDQRSRTKVMKLMDLMDKAAERNEDVAEAGIELLRLFLGLEQSKELKPWLTLAKLYGRIGQLHRSIEALERCLLLSSTYNLPLNIRKLEGWVEELNEGQNPFALVKDATEEKAEVESGGNVSP